MFRIIFIFILIQQLSLLAQDHGNKEKVSNVLKKSFIQFKWSNDFMYETDYYYTNGFAFEVSGPWAKKNTINSILIPSPEKSINQFGVTLVQDIYTPYERVDVEKQLDGDRPFAAYLLLGFIKKTYDPIKRNKIISELQFGVLGPSALGEETQNWIHDMLPTSERLNGWENQISNSVAINYSTGFYKSLYRLSWVGLTGTANGKLGIPFTHIKLGGGARIGYLSSYPKDFEVFSENRMTAFLFAEVFGKAVGYNATLQGGLFSSSTYTLDVINHFVGSYRLGISVSYNLLNLEMATTFNTPEFPGALSHRWSWIVIRAGF